jgi:hypothetical protein
VVVAGTVAAAEVVVAIAATADAAAIDNRFSAKIA